MNPADIIMISVLAALIVAALIFIFVRKRKGKGCSYSCDSCPYPCDKKH